MTHYNHAGDFPPPGQTTLLTDHEYGDLRNFWSLIDTRPSHINHGDGEGLPFSDQWFNAQPLETVVDYQTHPSFDAAVASIFNSFTPVEFDPHIPIPDAQQLTPDVLDAAQTLSGTQAFSLAGVPSDPRGYGISPQMQASMSHSTRTVPDPQYHPYSNDQRQHQPVSHIIPEGYVDMFRAVAPAVPPNRRAAAPPVIQFGTDRNFTGGNFNNGEADIEGKVTRRQEEILDCLQPNTSAAPTRASSPQRDGGAAESKSPLILRTRDVTVPVSQLENNTQPPKKRRKSRPKNSPDGDDAPEFDSFRVVSETTGRSVAMGSSHSMPGPGPFGGSTPVEEPAASAGGGKKRRAGGAPKKAPRENLTEEQKRENHIKSEQKRRTLIKEGYEDIQELVPNLKGAGLSKSQMLTSAGDFLDKLLSENAELERLLQQSTGRQQPV